MKIAFVFPGQGSQQVGMAKEICEHYEIARQACAEASDALEYDVASLCFNGPAEELNKTMRTQPCILTASVAMQRAVVSRGVEPAVVAGHSLGEYSGLVASGMLSLRDAARLTESRGRFMQEAVPEGKGMMAAIIGLDRDRVDEICVSLESGYASPANYNCPGQIVIAGEKAAVEEAVERCKAGGAKRAVPLSVSVPSHCRLMESASKRLAELLEAIEFRKPSVPIVNNADAAFLSTIEDVKASLVRQLSSPLLWEDSVRAIVKSGVETFVEIGPGKVLSGLIKRIDPAMKILNVEDVKSLEKALTELGIT